MKMTVLKLVMAVKVKNDEPETQKEKDEVQSHDAHAAWGGDGGVAPAVAPADAGGKASGDSSSSGEAASEEQLVEPFVVFPQAMSAAELFGSFVLVPSPEAQTAKHVGMQPAAASSMSSGADPGSGQGLNSLTSRSRRRRDNFAEGDGLSAVGEDCLIAGEEEEDDKEGEGEGEGEEEDGEAEESDSTVIEDDDDDDDDGSLRKESESGRSGREGRWEDGLLVSYLRTLATKAEVEAADRCWLVIDSDISGEWVESILAVVVWRTLYLSNGEPLRVPPNLTITVEATHAAHASPAMLSSCNVVALSEAMT